MMVAGLEARGCGIRRPRLKQVPGSLRSAHGQLSRAVELTRPFLMLVRRPHARVTRPKAERLARVNQKKKKSFLK
jgi:hypothetical protein